MLTKKKRKTKAFIQLIGAYKVYVIMIHIYNTYLANALSK